MGDKYLTFGDLSVGEEFISLPQAGDDKGHGGFKGTHFIFTKIGKDNAKGNKKGTLSKIPKDMPIIKVR